MGGTEILHKNLMRFVGIPHEINLIVSNCSVQNISEEKPNILWQHLNTDQDAVKMLHENKDRYDMIVFVSEWQRQKFIKEFSLLESKTCVIKNAIIPIPYVPRKETEKRKLIYTSTPWRGLNELIHMLPFLTGFELDVYSSTMIYGSNFADIVGDRFEPLYNRCRNTMNCHYRGYAMNKVVRKALQSANIFAYPSTFEETSCLAAIEAGAAGCEIIVTPLGALPETCDKYATFAELDNYQTALQNAINTYDPTRGKDISEYYNDKYSWDNRISQWSELFNNF